MLFSLCYFLSVSATKYVEISKAHNVELRKKTKGRVIPLTRCSACYLV